MCFWTWNTFFAVAFLFLVLTIVPIQQIILNKFKNKFKYMCKHASVHL